MSVRWKQKARFYLKISQRNKAVCRELWEVPMLGELLSDRKMLVQLFLLHHFSHNHMRYIYRQSYDERKEFCLNEISLQTGVQTKLGPRQTPPPRGAAQTPPGGQVLRARWVQAMHSAWSTTRCEAARAHPCLLLGYLFIRLHHLHLPPHQTGTYKAGCAGSGQATSQPSG